MVNEDSLSFKIHSMLYHFFKGNDSKIDEWMKTPNPSLGDLTPLEMFINGNGEKLLEWMEHQLSDNRDGSQ